MLLLPFTHPFAAAKISGLQATVVLLLMLLIKSKLLRVKMSFLGSAIGLLLLVSFLATTGALVLVSGGALLYAFNQKATTARAATPTSPAPAGA